LASFSPYRVYRCFKIGTWREWKLGIASEILKTLKIETMKKLICALGMVSFLSLGMIESASAQNFPTRQVSARAKGAIIGGGLGAAAGAIIHGRDPVAGGIVGAVIGAGAGYVVGNSEDKIRERRAYQYYDNNNRYDNRYRRDYRQQRRVYNNGYRY
jgi:hypothetical protein